MTTGNIEITPIAVVKSPFKERFGIPRQPGLVDARGSIVMLPDFDDHIMFDGITAFSHIWVTFLFHGNIQNGWKKKVKPPRLGGKKQVGVFASRSPHRPNFIGISALKLESVETGKPATLNVSGLDLLDGTPVLDIRPYISYSDSIPDAVSGFATDAPEQRQQVTFSTEAQEVLESQETAETDMKLISQILALDPRPAYKTRRTSERLFGMLLGDYEVKWQVNNGMTHVVELRITT